MTVRAVCTHASRPRIMSLLLDAAGVFALPIGVFFCLQHALTLRHQPNTTLSGWNTVALGHGTRLPIRSI